MRDENLYSFSFGDALITHLTQSTSELQITQITQITQIFLEVDSSFVNCSAEVGLSSVISGSNGVGGA